MFASEDMQASAGKPSVRPPAARRLSAHAISITLPGSHDYASYYDNTGETRGSLQRGLLLLAGFEARHEWGQHILLLAAPAALA